VSTETVIFSFRSVIKLAALLGFCSGVIFGLLFLGLSLYPDESLDKPPVIFALLIPVASSAIFALHSMLAYPIFYWISNKLGGLQVEYSKVTINKAEE
jgi:hypothetical protein